MRKKEEIEVRAEEALEEALAVLAGSEEEVHVLCASRASLVSQELRGDLNSQSLVTTLGLTRMKLEKGSETSEEREGGCGVET